MFHVIGPGPSRAGGANEVRTRDPLLAKQVLSQLSYSPIASHAPKSAVVGLGRVELPTSRLSGVRSNHLSYRPSAARTCAQEPTGGTVSPSPWDDDDHYSLKTE